MFERPRILPILVLACAALFVLKGVAVFSDTDTFFAAVGGAQASEKETKPEETAAPDETDEAGDEEKSAESPADSAAAGEPAQYSRAEIDVLEKLSNRRTELDERERALDLREKLLAASEARIGERIVELKGIEANIQGLINERDEAQTKQLLSLVKIYENMKPKDAARIFEELDMDVLLPVAQRMKEIKFAAVLAQMDPEKAKRLTVGLAKSQVVPTPAVASAGKG